MAPFAVVQINFINRGLALYPQTLFFPVYSSMLVLANTIFGALYYEEYLNLLTTPSDFGYFVFGCLLIVQGINLFRWRTLDIPEAKDEDEADDGRDGSPTGFCWAAGGEPL